jgi:hypothetical protein
MKQSGREKDEKREGRKMPQDATEIMLGLHLS